ncbi:Detected protein of unknown function [Hibiscus syriacus]|uniref:DUF4378 domain-containing protein n=1 Tax=Hibiscus syriacus TaxID=106335 RepID=A0A6A3ATV5_HIBSY|nr:Detected protein of unknown function [Hibiscus syriacus]
MDGFENKRVQNIEKFPGCLGRMESIWCSKDVGTHLWRSESSEDKVTLSELRRFSQIKKMGLDTLPRRQHNLSAQRYHSKGFSQQYSSHSDTPVEGWEQDQGFADKEMPSEINPCQELNYIDVHEVRQQSPMATYSRDSSPHKGKYKDNEFQEALEVLSSNRELFLKFLEEPNSKFSQHHNGFQSLSQPPEKMRITLLRPKMIEQENFAGKGSTKKPVRMGHGTGWDRKNELCDFPFPSPEVDEYPSQPTRIVVLKPNPGKSHDIKTWASPSPSSPRILLGDDSFKEPEVDDVQEPREVAKEITKQLRENLIGHKRDDTLLSSVFSNGYVGDDSSLDRSENEYAVEILSDSEVTSPTSRHSWDYINRFSSPYSSSSFSHASCSPESSVCREAKKRLSERWAMMASNGNSQEQRHVRSSSSILGEMLALSDAKKLVKSVPVSSTANSARLNIEFSDPESSKEQVPKELTKAKSVKSSLKGKVSSLFFSNNKKTNEDKCTGSQTAEESLSTTPETLGSPIRHLQKINNDAPQRINDSCNQVCLSPVLGRSVSKTPSPDLTGMGQKRGMTAVLLTSLSFLGGLSVAKPSILVRLSENQDQPSPISVLEPLFVEDETSIESAGSIKPVNQDGHNKFIKTLEGFSGVKEEQDWIFSVQSLLSAAGLNGKVCFESCIARWHSPESPLDPSLREKYANSNDEEHLHEAKLRQWRSNRKLIFDCVNAAVLEITGYGSSSCMRNMSLGWSHVRDMENLSSSLVDHVCAQMKEWISGDSNRLVDDDDGDEDSCSLVVERVVQKEVVGKGWVDQMRSEIHNLGSEIEGKLLQELVDEAVVDLTGMVF